MNRILLLLLFGFIATESSFAQCTIAIPTNVKISNVFSCSATMTWNAVPEAAYYMVKYKETTGTFILLPDQVTATTFTFTGLNPNKEYTFSVASYCVNNVNSGWKQVKKTTLKCSVPLSPAIANVTPYEADFHGSRNVDQLPLKCAGNYLQMRFIKCFHPQLLRLITSPDY